MRVIKLTNDQATTLEMYLLMTTNYRKDEIEACSRLSKEKRDDGSTRFPNMESNARWWTEADKILADVVSAIVAAPYTKED